MSLCLILLIVVVILLAKLWTEKFDNQQAILRTLSRYPQNELLVFVSALCLSSNLPIKPPPNNNIHCPQKPIVTVKQIGRLGNKMWEYISVWAAAKETWSERYVPSCMIRELDKILRNISFPPLSHLAYSPTQEYPVVVTADKVDHSNGSIILPDFIQLSIQGVPGGMCQTSGECSLGQTIPL